MVRSLIIGCALLVASTARAEVELKNDGFVSGGQATFQTGFVVGEAGAVRFVAPSAGRQLRKLQLLFGGATTKQNLTIKVFDDTAGQDAPGAELFMSDFELTGADNAMQELDLTSANVFVPAQFRVALYFQHAGAPTIASDSDGITADKNYIFAGTWKKSSALGLAGDWVIRAFVSDAGAAPDAGPGGLFCDTNADCGNRRYCDVDHHACVFDCQDNTECPNGGQCNNLGQCEGGGSGGDGGCQTTNGAVGGLMLLMAGLLVVLRRRAA